MVLFENAFVENAGAIMAIFLIFSLLLSMIGCYTTFKIGWSKERTEGLRNIYHGLNENRIECDSISEFMVDDGKNFLLLNDLFIEGQGEVKYEISKTLHRLHKLGVTLNKYGIDHKNGEIKKITHYIQMVYQSIYLDFVKLRCLQDRSKIIRLFYEKQLSKDNKLGLNQQEFFQLKETLDNESNDEIHTKIIDEFPSFRFFDTDNNGNIDIMEFENQLNIKYVEIFDGITKQYNSNKSPEDLAYEKEQREKEQNENLNLLNTFNKFKNFGFNKKKRKPLNQYDVD